MTSSVGFARRGRAIAPVVAIVGLVGIVGAVSAAMLPQRAAHQGDEPQDLSKSLEKLTGAFLPKLPPASAFVAGDRAIAAKDSVTGPIAVSKGTVDVYGTVTGDVVAWHGDVVVHGGGAVTGNAIAIGGQVRLEGGQVDGETLTLSADVSEGPEAAAAGGRTARELLLVGGWFAVLVVIAVGVLVLASDNLAAVADALERHYGSTLVAGVAGQVAFLPLLVIGNIALVLSVLGILLVPFATVAYFIIAAGLVTLGYLATALMIGRGWRAAPPGSERARRAATLKALVVGIVVLLSPWAVAAALASWPVAESLARGVAFAITWVACTAGLGAGLISRAGIKRASSGPAQRAMASPSWQTPTPVSGVVAARRPTATPTPGAR